MLLRLQIMIEGQTKKGIKEEKILDEVMKLRKVVRAEKKYDLALTAEVVK